MKQTKFEELSLHDKGILLFTEGAFLSYREYYHQRIELYELYDFFAEVYFDHRKAKIKKITAVSKYTP